MPAMLPGTGSWALVSSLGTHPFPPIYERLQTHGFTPFSLLASRFSLLASRFSLTRGTLAALTLLGIAALPQAAHAQTPAFTPPAGPITADLSAIITVGYTFTVGASAISVTDLGYFDVDLDGLTSSHVVSIWNGAGTQLGTGTVPAGVAGTLTGDYRYVSLGGSPIALSANTTYTIGATTTATGDETPIFVSVGAVAAASGVSLGAARATSGANTFATTDAFGAGHYMTPNFKFILGSTSAPEPGTLALLALGIVGGVVAKRRK